MEAYIGEGIHIFKVDNDKSLIKMFKLNKNVDEHIDLYVDISVLGDVPLEKEQYNDSTIEISNNDEDEVDKGNKGTHLDDDGQFFDVQIEGVGSKNLGYRKKGK